MNVPLLFEWSELYPSGFYTFIKNFLQRPQSGKRIHYEIVNSAESSGERE
jgi:hypothetical protein